MSIAFTSKRTDTLVSICLIVLYIRIGSKLGQEKEVYLQAPYNPNRFVDIADIPHCVTTLSLPQQDGWPLVFREMLNTQVDL